MIVLAQAAEAVSDGTKMLIGSACVIAGIVGAFILARSE